MSDSDPMLYAAKVARLSDDELMKAFHALVVISELTDYQTALLDEIQMRGILTSSEADAVMRTAK